jgi:hypothetical protein
MVDEGTRFKVQGTSKEQGSRYKEGHCSMEMIKENSE